MARPTGVEEDNTSYKCPIDSCTIPLDTIVRCSDSQHFGAHSQNLELLSEGLRSSRKSVRVQEDTLPLINAPERGTTIEILLRFMHNSPPPELKEAPLQDLLDLNAAGKKYVVHSAIYASQRAMNEQALDPNLGSYANRIRILMHKLQHGDTSDIDLIMRTTFNDQSKLEDSPTPEPEELKEFSEQLKQEYHAYVQYREQWEEWNEEASFQLWDTIQSMKMRNGKHDPSTIGGINIWGLFHHVDILPTLEGYKRSFNTVRFLAPKLCDGMLMNKEDWEETLTSAFEVEPAWKNFMK